MKKPKPPPKDYTLYRAQLSARIAMSALNGECELPADCTDVQYALYNIASAIQDIALAMEKQQHNERIVNNGKQK
jgi:hypothetical protein